jgi:SAM-dependent methyltransferase
MVNCPRCDAIGRERFAYYVMLRELEAPSPALFSIVANNARLKNLSLLEFSPRPNPSRRSLLEQTFRSYSTTDFDGGHHRADMNLDLTDLDQVSRLQRRFDVILCSHVLEHIPDYLTALRNLKALIAPGGLAILQVPLQEDCYTRVTWDEFHGDNTRVFHRFGFDLVEHIEKFYSEFSIYIAGLNVPVQCPEIKPGKYNWLRDHKSEYRIFETGPSIGRLLGFGVADYADAFVLRA